jgi:hypothetical protein
MVPSAAIITVSAPAATNTPGSPKRAASAGRRAFAPTPFSSVVIEPSGNSMNVKGAESFALMVFPFAGFVNET